MDDSVVSEITATDDIVNISDGSQISGDMSFEDEPSNQYPRSAHDGKRSELPSLIQPQPQFSGNGLRSIQEIPEKYRFIFGDYPCFNRIQSMVMDTVFYTSEPLVVTAPTGSGKTVIFELAIVHLLMLLESQSMGTDFKIVYMAPIKALCMEKLRDWSTKFGRLNIFSLEVTGDSDIQDLHLLQKYNIILTTPEKWDSLTRRWRDHSRLMKTVLLFLIDEVHVINEESRGPTLEAVVSRMKMLKQQQNSNDLSRPSLRFVAVSATIPNVEDLAQWLGSHDCPAKYFKIDEEMRPVKLVKVVKGYDANKKGGYLFDIHLSYKLKPIISQYSDGKPTLVFCSTRKSVIATAEVLAKMITFNFTDNQLAGLSTVCGNIADNKIRDLLKVGIGCHHAGLSMSDRNLIENAFRDGLVPVLMSTSTLAMGVNLPAHLVIIKSTQFYGNAGYQDYSDSQILQMIGRAGRPQFDTSAVAVIMTKTSCQAKYARLTSGSELIQSSLHRHLVEHLNAEVVLGTVRDLPGAVEWMRSTFLYVRASRHPQQYGLSLPPGNAGNANMINAKLQAMVQVELNALARYHLVELDDDGYNVQDTPTGRLMARYYVAFQTMRNFIEVTGSETLSDLLTLLSQAAEFRDVQLRNDEKGHLNALNSNKAGGGPGLRFPIKGRIKSRECKVNCLLQALMGGLHITEPALLQDANRVVRTAERVAKCLLEVVQLSNHFQALLSAVLLHKCVRCQLWENSPLAVRQLPRIGPVLAQLLFAAGKTSLQAVANSNPRDLERIVNRLPPFGNELCKVAASVPQLTLSVELDEKTSSLVVHADIANLDVAVNDKSHFVVVLVGDSDNRVLTYDRFPCSKLFQGRYMKEISVDGSSADHAKIHLISEKWASIDCEEMVRLRAASPVQPPSGAKPKPVKKRKSFMDTIKEYASRMADTPSYRPEPLHGSSDAGTTLSQRMSQFRQPEPKRLAPAPVETTRGGDVAKAAVDPWDEPDDPSEGLLPVSGNHRQGGRDSVQGSRVVGNTLSQRMDQFRRPEPRRLASVETTRGTQVADVDPWDEPYDGPLPVSEDPWQDVANDVQRTRADVCTTRSQRMDQFRRPEPKRLAPDPVEMTRGENVVYDDPWDEPFDGPLSVCGDPWQDGRDDVQVVPDPYASGPALPKAPPPPARLEYSSLPHQPTIRNFFKPSSVAPAAAPAPRTAWVYETPPCPPELDDSWDLLVAESEMLANGHDASVSVLPSRPSAAVSRAIPAGPARGPAEHNDSWDLLVAESDRLVNQLAPACGASTGEVKDESDEGDEERIVDFFDPTHNFSFGIEELLIPSDDEVDEAPTTSLRDVCVEDAPEHESVPSTMCSGSHAATDGNVEDRRVRGDSGCPGGIVEREMDEKVICTESVTDGGDEEDCARSDEVSDVTVGMANNDSNMNFGKKEEIEENVEERVVEEMDVEDSAHVRKVEMKDHEENVEERVVEEMDVEDSAHVGKVEMKDHEENVEERVVEEMDVEDSAHVGKTKEVKMKDHEERVEVNADDKIEENVDSAEKTVKEKLALDENDVERKVGEEIEGYVDKVEEHLEGRMKDNEEKARKNIDEKMEDDVDIVGNKNGLEKKDIKENATEKVDGKMKEVVGHFGKNAEKVKSEEEMSVEGRTDEKMEEDVKRNEMNKMEKNMVEEKVKPRREGDGVGQKIEDKVEKQKMEEKVEKGEVKLIKNVEKKAPQKVDGNGSLEKNSKFQMGMETSQLCKDLVDRDAALLGKDAESTRSRRQGERQDQPGKNQDESALEKSNHSERFEGDGNPISLERTVVERKQDTFQIAEEPGDRLRGHKSTQGIAKLSQTFKSILDTTKTQQQPQDRLLKFRPQESQSKSRLAQLMAVAEKAPRGAQAAQGPPTRPPMRPPSYLAHMRGVVACPTARRQGSEIVVDTTPVSRAEACIERILAQGLPRRDATTMFDTERLKSYRMDPSLSAMLSKAKSVAADDTPIGLKQATAPPEVRPEDDARAGTGTDPPSPRRPEVQSEVSRIIARVMSSSGSTGSSSMRTSSSSSSAQSQDAQGNSGRPIPSYGLPSFDRLVRKVYSVPAFGAFGDAGQQQKRAVKRKAGSDQRAFKGPPGAAGAWVQPKGPERFHSSTVGAICVSAVRAGEPTTPPPSRPSSSRLSPESPEHHPYRRPRTEEVMEAPWTASFVKDSFRSPKFTPVEDDDNDPAALGGHDWSNLESEGFDDLDFDHNPRSTSPTRSLPSSPSIRQFDEEYPGNASTYDLMSNFADDCLGGSPSYSPSPCFDSKFPKFDWQSPLLSSPMARGVRDDPFAYVPQSTLPRTDSEDYPHDCCVDLKERFTGPASPCGSGRMVLSLSPGPRRDKPINQSKWDSFLRD